MEWRGGGGLVTTRHSYKWVASSSLCEHVVLLILHAIVPQRFMTPYFSMRRS